MEAFDPMCQKSQQFNEENNYDYNNNSEYDMKKDEDKENYIYENDFNEKIEANNLKRKHIKDNKICKLKDLNYLHSENQNESTFPKTNINQPLKGSLTNTINLPTEGIEIKIKNRSDSWNRTEQFLNKKRTKNNKRWR